MAPKIPTRPAPKSFDILVTPAIATEYLEHNHRNRQLSVAGVVSLSQQMTKGQWHYDGSPIRFDWDGNLIDGQHRLNAIIASDTEQVMHVVTGLDPATQVTMDTGRKRSFADTLHMNGKSNAKSLASIVQVGYRWYALNMRNLSLFGGLGQHGSMQLQRTDLLEFEELFSDNLAKAAEYAESMRRVLPVPPRMLGTLAWLILQSRYADKAEEFLARLKDGAGLEEGSPILVLRNLYAASRGETTAAQMLKSFGQGIHAWNLYVAGRSDVKILRAPIALPDPK